MTTKADILKALDQVTIPRVERSLVALNMVCHVELASGQASITLGLTPLGPQARDKVVAEARNAILRNTGLSQVEIKVTEPKPAEFNHFHHVIAVMSGKGGVGKSLIAGLLAIALNRQHYEVGILDADLTGPSIPLMFGLEARPLGSDKGVLPVRSRSGIEVMSINLLLPHQDDPLMWRGPAISRTITQFWQQVVWGDLDYLVVDLPPGTSDAPITVMQALHLSGVVMVFTPQVLATMIVRKAAQMAQHLKVPILGLVENMSHLVSPETGRPLSLFGKSKGSELSQATGAPFLGAMPLDPALADLCDRGQIESYNSPAFQALAQSLLAAVPRSESHHHLPEAP
ncbi:MAG: Mrp/NBP35 family ATP-binding protein [Chloroflexota bacterium]|nr:Mrp/NBP35 family ATP-binding protein [Chloroflexota bacterium]